TLRPVSASRIVAGPPVLLRTHLPVQCTPRTPPLSVWPAKSSLARSSTRTTKGSDGEQGMSFATTPVPRGGTMLPQPAMDVCENAALAVQTANAKAASVRVIAEAPLIPGGAGCTWLEAQPSERYQAGSPFVNEKFVSTWLIGQPVEVLRRARGRGGLSPRDARRDPSRAPRQASAPPPAPAPAGGHPPDPPSTALDHRPRGHRSSDAGDRRRDPRPRRVRRAEHRA